MISKMAEHLGDTRFSQKVRSENVRRILEEYAKLRVMARQPTPKNAGIKKGRRCRDKKKTS